MLRSLLFGAGYVLMGLLGVAGLVYGDDTFSAFWATLLLLIAVAGAAKWGFRHRFDRQRPDPVLGTAPSGAPATFFRRSPFTVVLSVLVTGALALWCAAAAVALFRAGHDGWALLLAGLAALLLWPVVVAAMGRVAAGGLWLTEAGVEHRNGAVRWAVPWSDLQAVVAAEPIRLQLRPGAAPRIERTVPWIWSYELRKPADQLGIVASDLAGGPALIVAMLAHYLGEPRIRERLGTAESWAGGPH
jgi:hypothetical protein